MAAKKYRVKNLVSGAKSNHRHTDFQSAVGRLLALYFNKLAGRPLPNLHHNAQLIHAKLPQLIILMEYECAMYQRMSCCGNAPALQVINSVTRFSKRTNVKPVLGMPIPSPSLTKPV